MELRQLIYNTKNTKKFYIVAGLFAFILVLAGCGGGGGDGSGSGSGSGSGFPSADDGGGAQGGGSEEATLLKVAQVIPSDNESGIPVSTEVTMTFNKEMNPETFFTGLEISPDVTKKSIDCGPTDCKTIIITLKQLFKFGVKYTLTLKTGKFGIRDQGNHGLEADHIWIFTSETFESAFNFTSLVIDGEGMEEQRVDGNGDPVFEADGTPDTMFVDDAGECTAIALDKEDPARTVHIAYLSVTNRAPKHAYCKTTLDCSQLENWEKEIIDPAAIGISNGYRLGRDINLAIENKVSGQAGRLHVSYRDFLSFDPDDPIIPGIKKAINQTELAVLHNDDLNILKYATKDLQAVDPSIPETKKWKTVKVYDATNAITDTYIKVDDSGRIHISFHAKNQEIDSVGNWKKQHAFWYATCTPSTASNQCLETGDWAALEIDGGSEDGKNNFAQPNFIFVKGNAIHLSYYANGTLKYATCTILVNNCTVHNEWKTGFVDNPGELGIVGTDSSLFVNDKGIHITYKDNGNSGGLKYALCKTGLDCTKTENWIKITVDNAEGMGRSTQIKIDATGRRHVVYGDRLNDYLFYTFCEGKGDCTNPSDWSSHRIDIDVGVDNYISVHLHNKLQTIYLSTRGTDTSTSLNRSLKFIFGHPKA